MTRTRDVDHGFVAAKRAAGAGWGAIARMTGCAEVDLRRRHDLTFVGDAVPCRAESPREVVAAALRGVGLGGDAAMIVARLWMANGARCRSEDLARGIAGGGAAQEICREARLAARRLGIGFVVDGAGFALTADGVVRVGDLAGRPGRRS